ncbi:MAG: hypothetical protein P8188_07940, partial [Gemmatimonadota bacterium]
WTDRGENRDGPVGPLTFRWPHAVAGTGGSLYIADAGNHRVLGWADCETACQGGPPDLVLGQEDFTSNREWPYGPQSAGAHRFPYDISLGVGVLAVSDTANNRILLHRPPPTEGRGVLADAVLAQPDFQAHGENRWEGVVPDSLCWPYGIHLHGDTLAVADSGNNRVMLWRRKGDAPVADSRPEAGRPRDSSPE